MPNWSRVRERVAVDLLRWTPKGTLSRGIGWAARRRVPRPLARARSMAASPATSAPIFRVLERPLDAFERFDDFFTRPLRDGARPIAEGDGRGRLARATAWSPRPASPTAAASSSARGATTPSPACSPTPPRRAPSRAAPTPRIYLSPRDYHRIHSPVDGKVTGYRHIPGAFFPVNPMSVRNVAGLFSINERLVTYLDSDVGRVAVVAVAATGVGCITVAYDRDVRTHRSGDAGRHGWAQRYASPRPLPRGAELGMFHLGSTVILLFEPGRVRLDAVARPDAARRRAHRRPAPTSSGSSPPKWPRRIKRGGDIDFSDGELSEMGVELAGRAEAPPAPRRSRSMLRVPVDEVPRPQTSGEPIAGVDDRAVAARARRRAGRRRRRGRRARLPQRRRGRGRGARPSCGWRRRRPRTSSRRSRRS